MDFHLTTYFITLRLTIVNENGYKEVYIPHNRVPYYDLESADYLDGQKAENL